MNVTRLCSLSLYSAERVHSDIQRCLPTGELQLGDTSIVQLQQCSAAVSQQDRCRLKGLASTRRIDRIQQRLLAHHGHVKGTKLWQFSCVMDAIGMYSCQRTVIGVPVTCVICTVMLQDAMQSSKEMLSKS